MTKKEYDKNSVNGTKANSLEGSSLSQFPMGRQVGSDRQTATVTQTSQQRTTKKKKLRKRWKKKTLKIGTWNVRTLHQKGKLDNAVQEMNRIKISILGLAEMRWKDSGKTKKNGYTIIYSGNENHFNGVGIIIHPKISENLSGFGQFLIVFF